MDRHERLRIKQLLGSPTPEEKVAGVCAAAHAVSRCLASDVDTQSFNELAAVLSTTLTSNFVVQLLEFQFSKHCTLIHTAAADILCALVLAQDNYPYSSPIPFTSNGLMCLSTLPSTPLLKSGADKLITGYLQSMADQQRSTRVMQLIEDILQSDTISDRYTPTQILHTTTWLMNAWATLEAHTLTSMIHNQVCANGNIVAHLRRLCTQSMYGAAKDFVRDEVIRCLEILLRLLGPAWTVESTHPPGEFVSLLVAVVRGEIQLLLEELLYWSSGTTYQDESAAVAAEKERRTARFGLLASCLNIFQLCVSYLCGESSFSYDCEHKSWEQLPTDRLLHIQQSLHQTVSNMCEFIGNSKRITPVKPLAATLARNTLLCAKAVCLYSFEDDTPAITELVEKMLKDMAQILNEDDVIDDVDSMLSLVDALLQTQEDEIIVQLMYTR